MTDPSVDRVKIRFRRRLAAAKPEDLEPTLKQLSIIHDRIQTWLRGFPSALQEARKGTENIPQGWIWQDPFIGFFETYDLYQKQLYDLGRKLNSLALVFPEAKQAKFAVEPPRDARVNKAIGTIDFAQNPETGEDHIVYPEGLLKGWYKEFSDWTIKSSKLIKSFL